MIKSLILQIIVITNMNYKTL